MGFFAERMLKRIDLDGESVQTIAEASDPQGGSWNQDNVILVSRKTGEEIVQVPASGGGVTPVTELLSREKAITTVFRTSFPTAVISFIT